MSRDEVFTLIRDVMVRLFELPPEDITPDAKLVEDLELDSIDAIDMLVELQARTDKRIDEEELKKLRTVGDIVNLASSYLPST
jgi:acyl carrier protein